MKTIRVFISLSLSLLWIGSLEKRQMCFCIFLNRCANVKILCRKQVVYCR
jgi:hypothetical protein